VVEYIKKDHAFTSLADHHTESHTTVRKKWE
jgi:hypothetical protein